MPISSGALGWPESYFRKPEEEEDSLTRNSFNSVEGQPLGQTVWTVQLADRDQFELWKQTRDRVADKRRTKFKRKTIKKQKKAQKQIERNNISTILRRRRHRQCFLLTSTVALISSCIIIGSIYLVTHYMEEDSLGPAVFQASECEGKWRTHFLAYTDVLPNGTVLYHCCYLPGVNASARYYILQKGDIWPDGYLIRNQDCISRSSKCHDFDKKFAPGTPPCSVAPASRRETLTGVVCGCILAFYMNFQLW